MLKAKNGPCSGSTLLSGSVNRAAVHRAGPKAQHIKTDFRLKMWRRARDSLNFIAFASLVLLIRGNVPRNRYNFRQAEHSSNQLPCVMEAFQ